MTGKTIRMLAADGETKGILLTETCNWTVGRGKRPATSNRGILED